MKPSSHKPSISKYSKKKPGAEPVNPARKKQVIAASIGLLLLLLLGASYLYLRGDPQLARVKELQDEMFNTPRDKMTDEERRAKWGEMREEEKKLSPEQREQLHAGIRKRFEQKMNTSGARYFAMSPEDRKKEIARQIASDLERQKRWAQGGGKAGRGGPGGGKGGGPGGGGGGPGGGGGKGGGGGGGPGGQAQAGAQAGQQGGPGGPGGPPGGRGQRTPEQNDDRTRERLINSTPQARAGGEQMRLDKATARIEMGLPPTGGGRGGFGRP
jgi:hypothetical protein